MKKYVVMITDKLDGFTWELSWSCDKDMSLQAMKYEQKRFGDQYKVFIKEKN